MCYYIIIAIIIAKHNNKSKTREDVAMLQNAKRNLGILYNHLEIFMCYEITQRGVNA